MCSFYATGGTQCKHLGKLFCLTASPACATNGAMNITQIRAKVKASHIPTVAKLTGVPLRTLYRFSTTTVVPLYHNLVAIERWASKEKK
jgi:hypothetical protein